MLENDVESLLGVAGLVVGLIGIIVSVFLYFHSKNRKILEHEMNSTQLITKKMTSIPNLKVTINDQSIRTLISTTIKFSNTGNQSIVLSDFAKKEPLGITITGCLHSYDVSADNPNSTPDLQPITDKSFYVKFDFLKQKQSFSITLLHDGTVHVFGELTNGEQREHRNIWTDNKFMYVVTSCCSIVSIIASFFISKSLEPSFFTVMGLGALGIGLMFLAFLIREE